MQRIYKAYKYRLYPTEKQKVLIEKHFGACRFFYNYCLGKKIHSYEVTGKSLSRFTLNRYRTILRKDPNYEWMKEINAQALGMELNNLESAYSRFFKEKKGFPKFKSKHHDKPSFTAEQGTEIKGNRIKLIKFKEGIKFKPDKRQIEGTIKQATVTRTTTGKYFISLLVDTGLPFPELPPVDKSKTIGVDLGITHFATLSDGTKIDNPKYLRKDETRLKKAQRRASKKQKGSNNRRKANKRVATIHERIRNRRIDFLHKLTSKLISENQTIAIEDLNVEGMLKNHNLAKAISDASWFEFKRQLTYKAKWNARNILTINRFEPSTKLCNKCLYKNGGLTLKDRVWTCPRCNSKHDRDINAAMNIRDIAFKEKQIRIASPNLKLAENDTLVHSEKQEMEV